MILNYNIIELVDFGFGGIPYGVNHVGFPCGGTFQDESDDPLYYATLWFGVPPLTTTRVPILIKPPSQLGLNDAFFDLNDNGDAVGGLAQVDPDIFPFLNDFLVTGARALLCKAGQLTDLSAAIGGNGSVALGISNPFPLHPAGLVTGVVQLGLTNAMPRGFVYDPVTGRIQLIPALSGALDSYGVAINNKGVVVGYSGGHIVTFSQGVLKDLQPTVPVASTSIPNGGLDINDSNMIVTGVNGNPQLYDPHRTPAMLVDIQLPPGFPQYGSAWAINNEGDVVGGAIGQGGAFIRAFIFNQNVNGGVAIDLNTLIPPGSRWVLTMAYDISANGYIVGVGTLNGKPASFLLTPEAAPIPMLKSLVLFPSTVVGGGDSRGTVTLEAPAPPIQGVDVFLGSDDPQVAKPRVPSVHINGGDSSASFNVQTFAFPWVSDGPKTKHAIITAAAGVVRYAGLTVNQN